jgi:hypothetical protein
MRAEQATEALRRFDLGTNDQWFFRRIDQVVTLALVQRACMSNESKTCHPLIKGTAGLVLATYGRLPLIRMLRWCDTAQNPKRATH